MFLQPRSLSDIQKYADAYYGSMNAVAPPPPPYLPFLPAHYTFNCGVRAQVRHMARGGTEEREIYDMFVPLMGKDDGYSFDEYPTFETFKHYQILNNHCIVIEDGSTRDIIAFISIGQYWPYRGIMGEAHESSMLITPKYRAHKIGTELMTFLFAMAKEAGFTCHYGDCALTNLPMRRMEKKCGFIVHGVTPKSMYLLDKGWTDVVVSILETDKVPDTFSEIINRQVAKTSSSHL